MKHKVAELTGDLLDAAVALADGRLVVKDEPGWTKGDYKKQREEYGGQHVVRWYGSKGELGGWEPLRNQGSPSTDWAIGGPIIESEHIELEITAAGDWTASVSAWLRSDGWMNGPTPLIAAMRAYVAAKLGATVDLPA